MNQDYDVAEQIGNDRMRAKDFDDLSFERREGNFEEKNVSSSQQRVRDNVERRRKLTQAAKFLDMEIDLDSFNDAELKTMFKKEIAKTLADIEAPLRGQRKNLVKKKKKRAKNPDSNYSYRKKRKLKANRKKRAPTKWVRALKDFNQGRPTFCIPKKGTDEYAQVKAYMQQL